MITEALNWFKTIIDSSSKVELTPIEGDPRRLIVSQRGEREILDLPESVRSHVVRSLESMLSAMALHGSAESTIWHSETEVVLVIDDVDRHDNISLPLVKSQQFMRLMELSQSGRCTQRDLVRLLKHTLNGCVDETLLPIFRKVDFTRQSDGTASINHGRESLGRSVESAVNATGEIPEFITATIPVYGTAGIATRSKVRMSLDIDADQEVFTLTPLPGELEHAVDQAQAWLHAELDAESIPVFYGTP